MELGTRRFLPVLLAVSVAASACGGDKSSVDVDMPGAKLAKRDSSRVPGPGDVRITTSDGSIELALIGDSIYTGLGPTVLDKVKAKTDTAAVKGNGFGAGIEKMVKGTVASALSQQVQYPVSNLQDVSYDNGKLEFRWKDGVKSKIFENTRTNGKPANEAFRPEDAQRFVDAVHARMKART